MTSARVREAQRAVNEFRTKRLAFMPPVRVDGEKGPATNKALRQARFYLGYVEERRTDGRGDDIDNELIWRLLHPKRTNRRWRFDRKDVRRGIKRRATQRAHARRDRWTVRFRRGVGTFDGIPVARWMIPKLQWARDSGRWLGQLVSGWRSPAYSEHLCIAMCGQPTCPGRCAGRTTNHAKDVMPDGALDVTHYEEFAAAMREAPESTGPPILNDLGPADPVHFSHSGH